MKKYDKFLLKINNFFFFCAFLSQNVPNGVKIVIILYDNMTKNGLPNIII